MSQERIAVSRARDVTLPLVKILTGRGFVTGKSGSGKSNSVNVIVEEILDLGRPLIIIDTDGEYWGLKEQYRVLHLGNDEQCDAKVTAADADTIVEVALEGGVPVILDISGFLREEDADEVVHRVVKRLFQREKALKEPFLLIAEEVHEYIPEQGGLSDAGETLIQVAKRGRKHGLGFIGVSQRPASVDKDFITQCEWIAWHRLTWKNDTDVVRTLLGSDASDEVEELDTGEALLMTDWDEQVERVQFRKKRTYDAGQTPGFDDFDPPDLLPVGAGVLERFGVDGEEIPDDQDGRTATDSGTGQADGSTDTAADDEGGAAEAPVAETQVVEDGDGNPAGEAVETGGEAAADVAGETESVEPLDVPEDGDAPAVVDADPVPESTDESARASPAAGSDATTGPNRTAPMTGPSRARRRRPPPDQPEVVEFGQMVMYLSRRVGRTIGRGVGRVIGAVGGRAGKPWREGTISDDDLVVVGWLLLVVLFLAAVTVTVAVAI
jgi:hypothetical protein